MAVPNGSSKPHLLRILGVGFGIAVVVGGTVGSGILLTPGLIAAQLRSSWLIMAAWTMGGIFAFFCTQAVVELGTALPQAGGWLVFSRRAFGPYGGFLVGCCDWMMQSSSIAYLGAAFSEFAADFAPALRTHERLVAAACLIVLTMLNWLGLRTGSRTQQITSVIKTLGLLLLVAACFLMSPKLAPGHVAVSQTLLHLPPIIALLAILAALQPIIISYDGWYSAIYFTEEDEDPTRNLPRSSFIGLLASAAIFLLVNAALLHLFSIDVLAASQSPAADAAGLLFGNAGKVAILILAMLTVIGAINATILIAPRILFAMARYGFMPESIAAVNSGGTPGPALFLTSAIAIVQVLSGGYVTLVAVTAILCVAIYLSGFLSLFVLRVREPNLPRPFKMWGYPFTNLAITIGTAGFLVAAIIGDLIFTSPSRRSTA